MRTARDPIYAGHRYPAEIISYAVWLYFRFPLSLRMKWITFLTPIELQKEDTCAVLGQACPGSEQEGPARVAQCPHERRSGGRGGGLLSPRGEPGGATAGGF